MWQACASCVVCHTARAHVPAGKLYVYPAGREGLPPGVSLAIAGYEEGRVYKGTIIIWPRPEGSDAWRCSCKQETCIPHRSFHITVLKYTHTDTESDIRTPPSSHRARRSPRPVAVQLKVVVVGSHSSHVRPLLTRPSAREPEPRAAHQGARTRWRWRHC